MKKISWCLILYILLQMGLVGGLAGCKEKGAGSKEKELIIFHAGSLSVPFREISSEFQKQFPGISVKAEAAGSRACARKICDLQRECDIMASADHRVVANLLMPTYADFNIRFALNEMVIAYTDKSISSDKVTSDNWYELLLKDEVIFGRSEPNLDPCGYRTLMVFQLAEKYYEVAGLSDELQKKDACMRPKETDLLVLLEAGEIDYLFIYRSVATQHGLKMILLPDEVNLKSAKFAELYNTATVSVSGKKVGQFITCRGEPMEYSVTIPKNSQNPEAAREWIALLLSKKGREIMERNGQPFIKQVRVDGFSELPDELKPFCK